MPHDELSEPMKKFLTDYCYANKCWVCGVQLKERGTTVCRMGCHRSDVEQDKLSDYNLNHNH